MSRYSNFILLGLWFCGVCLHAQKKSFLNRKKEKGTVTELNEVKVYGFKNSKTAHQGQKVITLENKEIIRNPTNFTETLRFNSPIAFRDFGNGGVSSARFRGTSGTNTSVLWNGIPINAVGNGQTDFNALSINTTDEIKVVSGGSSVAYGSGAIGGSIIVKDNLSFSKHQNAQVFSSTGSFTTSNNFAKLNIGTDQWALKLSAAYNRSKNDYDFLDTRFRDEDGNTLKNENADYDNYNIDASLGYKFSNTNKLYLYTTKYEGDRFFSAGLPNPSSGKERNQDISQRNLLKWIFQFSKFSQSLKLAYLTQESRYFNNRFVNRSNFIKSKSWYADYNLNYRHSEIINFNYFITYENILGYTDIISKRTRESLAIGGSVNYKPLKSTTTTFSIRNENNSDFSVPVIVSFAGEQKIGIGATLKTNISTNYRVPTYNELFWPQVGDPNLEPEKSKQFEIGGDFKWRKISVSATYFYIDIEDKVQWLPSGSSNLWRPRNLEKVVHKGFEISAKAAITVLKKHYFNFITNFTQTLAKDLETNRRLPFVPQRLWNFNIDYNFKRINFFIQHLYQSKVFTSNNLSDFESIESFGIYNFGINYIILKKTKNKVVVGAKVNNVFNSLYYFTTLRPNPGRNFSVNVNYKFR